MNTRVPVSQKLSPAVGVRVVTYFGEVFTLRQHDVHAYASLISEFKNLHTRVLNDRHIEHPFLVHHLNCFPRTLEVKSQKHFNEPTHFTY